MNLVNSWCEAELAKRQNRKIGFLKRKYIVSKSLRAKGVNAAIVSYGGKVAGDLLASEDTLDSATVLVILLPSSHGQVEGCIEAPSFSDRTKNNRKQ